MYFPQINIFVFLCSKGMSLRRTSYTLVYIEYVFFTIFFIIFIIHIQYEYECLQYENQQVVQKLAVVVIHGLTEYLLFNFNFNKMCRIHTGLETPL